MTLEELLALVTQHGYDIRSAEGGFIVTGPGAGDDVLTEEGVFQFFEANGVIGPATATNAGPKPSWWPDGVPWPPMIPASTDSFGRPIPAQFDTRLFLAVQKANQPQEGVFSDAAEAQRAADEATRASAGETDVPTQQWEVVGITDGGYTIQPAQPGQPVERFLGSVEEGGWIIDQFGVDEDNITRRVPRQQIQDPLLTIKQQIAQAIEAADVLDMSDANFAKAVAKQDFLNRPTDAERLMFALELAQSPSDYLTLVGLYTGAISRETANPGERIAPLAPFLQDAARRFFMDVRDVPGVVLTPEAERDLDVRGNLSVEEFDRLTDEQRAEAEAIADAGGLEALLQQRVEEAGAGGPLAGLGVPLPTPPEPAPAQPPATPAEIPSFQEQVASRQQAGTIAPDIVEGIQAGTFTPEPLEPFLRQQLKTREIFAKLSPEQQEISTGIEKAGGLELFLIQQQRSKTLGTKKAPSLTQEELFEEAEEDQIPSFKHGGVAKGPPGEPSLAILHGGETVLPAPDIFGDSGFFGDVFRVPKIELPGLLTAPSRVQIPSLTGVPFRSAQTRRGMSPTAMRLFQSLVEQSGVPFEDFRQQEERATSIGGPRRVRSRFRRTPSLV